VAWPSMGGLVVSKFDTNMWDVEIETVLVPEDVARLRLCTSMDEKAQMLKERFRGKMWGNVEDYRGKRVHWLLGAEGGWRSRGVSEYMAGDLKNFTGCQKGQLARNCTRTTMDAAGTTVAL
jgi:hypothetical protein